MTASDGTASDQFGIGVAIAGDAVVIGANFDDDTGPNSGSAYVFQRHHGGLDSWGEVEKLTASDGTGMEQFGDWKAVATATSNAVVGAFLDDDNGMDSGSAYVFLSPEAMLFSDNFESGNTAGWSSTDS